ncbi:hypothetical protein ACIBG8_24655 [Nonomuraea sp. NPDC050556]|uniref:hypothetical protein n=1 Tax=Nonomuraea sp. NPDC050556 TaxID=3364369 RepID=UPI003799BC35
MTQDEDLNDLFEIAATDALLDALSRGEASGCGDPAARLLSVLTDDVTDRRRSGAF